MTARTPAEFKVWAKLNKPIAKAVCAAMAIAQVERERVNAYVLPIFQTYRFLDENGAQIDSPDKLFLSEDDAMCKAFYAACDVAHRAHGWKGSEGSCPALTAANLVIKAENALLEAGCEFLGLKEMPSALYGGDKRKEMLDLLLKACLGT